MIYFLPFYTLIYSLYLPVFFIYLSLLKDKLLVLQLLNLQEENFMESKMC